VLERVLLDEGVPPVAVGGEERRAFAFHEIFGID
jgi:hypothetical protein